MTMFHKEAQEEQLVTSWEEIQKNTFTRWCNFHLKKVHKEIKNLSTDFSDGLHLIALLQVLSNQKIKKYHKKPIFRQMKLENVSIALLFTTSEKIKLVSIDSKAVVDGNLKLILGLMWTLIQHYSLSIPGINTGKKRGEKLSPEQQLLTWVQSKIPELNIKNFKSDWQTGVALGALVNCIGSGLCSDWETWDPQNRIQNAAKAMALAEKWLGVPQVITPAEITNHDADSLSIMTYLSEFPKARLKHGAPLPPTSHVPTHLTNGKDANQNLTEKISTLEISDQLLHTPNVANSNGRAHSFSELGKLANVKIRSKTTETAPNLPEKLDKKDSRNLELLTVNTETSNESQPKRKYSGCARPAKTHETPEHFKERTGCKVVQRSSTKSENGEQHEDVENESQVETSWPDEELGVAEKRYHFKIDAQSLAPRGDNLAEAHLNCTLEMVTPVVVEDEYNGTYEGRCAPNEHGVHQLHVDYDGLPIEGSPFSLNAAEAF